MLVVDMDDTLLSDDLTISKKNIEALTKINKQGVSIVFCSGRASSSMINYIREVGILTDNDYYVSYNGAIINTVKGDNIFSKYIEGDLLKDILNIGRENKVDIQLYHTKDFYVENYTRRTQKYENMCKLKAKVIDNLLDIESTIKVLFNYDDIEVLKKVLKQVEVEYRDFVHVFFSKPNFVEVLNREANKGIAVKYLANKLGINREEIIAIGDSYNDIHMIEYAGLGIAMKNGRNGVKKVADYVTKVTNNESAVANVIEKFIIKKRS